MPSKGPGLPSIRSARERRDRSDTVRRPLGFTPMVNQAKETPWKARLVVLAGAVFVTGLYFFVNRGGVSAEKDRLLAEHRAAEATIGAEWRPLRDRIERAVVDLAAPFPGELASPALRARDVRRRPGLYLRLLADDARDPATLRRAAKESTKDGFVGCLLRPGPNTPTAAEALGAAPFAALADAADAGTDAAEAGVDAADAGAGAGAPPADDEQLWNLREAYRASRVLSDEWSAEVRAATDGLRLRIFQEQLDRAVKAELPKAARIVKRAEHLLVVLDEPTPEISAAADGGPPAAEAVQLVAHPTRILVVDLATGEPLLRMRRTVEGAFVMAGGRLPDPAVADAMRRQVNNCALAQEVGQVLDGGELTPP